VVKSFWPDLPLVRCVDAEDLDRHAATPEYLTLISPSGMDDEQGLLSACGLPIGMPFCGKDKLVNRALALLRKMA
jgi:hypothetical protein